MTRVLVELCYGSQTIASALPAFNSDLQATTGLWHPQSWLNGEVLAGTSKSFSLASRPPTARIELLPQSIQEIYITCAFQANKYRSMIDSDLEGGNHGSRWLRRKGASLHGNSFMEKTYGLSLSFRSLTQPGRRIRFAAGVRRRANEFRRETSSLHLTSGNSTGHPRTRKRKQNKSTSRSEVMTESLDMSLCHFRRMGHELRNLCLALGPVVEAGL